jgi:ubiquitin-conjugating enzyme E2 Z
MVSIQSLMDDMPYHNEPGFEKEALSGKSRRTSAEPLEAVTTQYNLKITHETIRIAVCDVLEEVHCPLACGPIWYRYASKS